MSSKEKQNLISIVTGVVVTIPYIVYIFNKYNSETFTANEELRFWAVAILLMIPLRIVGMIIGYIVFSILKAIMTGKEEIEDSVEDERDRIIELKGDRTTTDLFVFGFTCGLIAVLFGASLGVMFAMIIVLGFISEIIGTLSKFYYYRKGL